jgi:hypothetical protein
VHYCLRLQVIYDRANRTIHSSQQKYVEDILKRFNMQNFKPSIAHNMEANVESSKDMCPQTSEKKIFMANILS